jgi:hypothetical protein
VPSDIVCFFLLYTISSRKEEAKKGESKKKRQKKEQLETGKKVNMFMER